MSVQYMYTLQMVIFHGENDDHLSEEALVSYFLTNPCGRQIFSALQTLPETFSFKPVLVRCPGRGSCGEGGTSNPRT